MAVTFRETKKVGFTVWYVFARPEKISFHVSLTHDGTVNSVSNNPTIGELGEALDYLSANVKRHEIQDHLMRGF